MGGEIYGGKRWALGQNEKWKDIGKNGKNRRYSKVWEVYAMSDSLF